MQLHRTSGTPDWQSTPPTRQNGWQRLAAATNGLVTIGNIITIIGFGLVIYGIILLSHRAYWNGLVVIMIGRLCDIADGWAAHITSTKSPLGESFDAVFDKLGTGATLIGLWLTRLVPWWAIIVLLAPHIINSFVSLIALRRNIRIHPTRRGKTSMALAWICLLSFIGRQALLQQTNLSTAMTTLTYGLLLISTIAGILAAQQYIGTVFFKQPAK